MNLAREPIVHFFALAGLLFAVEAYFSAGQKTQIVVSQATADYLIRQREDLELRQLDAAERARVVDAYVEDEILYNEAYRRGLDRGDSRMRRNMILKMRGLLTGEVAVPDEETLTAYFEENRQKFTRSASYEVEQLHFDTDVTPPADLDGFLAAGGEAQAGVQLRRMPRMTRRVIAGTFGPEAGPEVMASQDDAWHGPFDSGQGVYFFRVLARTPAQVAELDDVRSYLQGDWMMERSRSLIEAEVARLLPEYDVIVEAEL